MAKRIKTVRAVLEYHPDNVCALDSYNKFIEKHIEQGNKIPARVLKRFFSMFKFKIYNKYEIDADLQKEKILQRFGAEKGFTFIVIEKGEVLYSFNHMINELCLEMKKNYSGFLEKTKVEQRKKKVCYFIFAKMHWYKQKAEKHVGKPLLSNYALGAITAYFMNVLGWNFGGKDAKTKKLYDSMKGMIRIFVKKNMLPVYNAHPFLGNFEIPPSRK
ncbi:MAG: hypothetical protein NT150_02115 [Bacteroidetes bacterium]|nr:hypothetical protein [Bacteroidota bacterium]